MAAPTQGERAVATTWCTLDSEGKTTGVPKAKCKTSMDTAGELDESTKRSNPRGVSLEAQQPSVCREIFHEETRDWDWWENIRNYILSGYDSGYQSRY